MRRRLLLRRQHRRPRRPPLAAQQQHLGAAYTRKRRPVQLVWSGWFDRVDHAWAFEKQVQGWSRKKRKALIDGEYNELPALSRRSPVQRRDAAEG